MIMVIGVLDWLSYLENREIKLAIAQMSKSSFIEFFVTEEMQTNLLLSRNSALLLLAYKHQTMLQSVKSKEIFEAFLAEKSRLNDYVMKFELALNRLRMATSEGVKFEVTEVTEEQSEEIELETIDEIGTLLADYKSKLNQYQSIIDADLGNADKYMTEVVVPVYDKILPLVEELNEDAKNEIYEQTQIIDEDINSIFMTQYVATVIGVVLSIIIGYFLARRISGPIEKLKQTALSIADGNLEEKVEVNSKKGDEITELSIAFNKMTEQLNTSMARERHYLAAAARASIEAERRRADALESANKAKSIFLSRVSHELRTPLNAIIGFSNILNTRVEPESLHKYAHLPRIIHKAGHHLLKLVNDILDVVQNEQGKVSVKLIPCHLGELIKSSIELCNDYIEKNNIEIITTNVDFNVIADPLRLKQVITNILSNALKYNTQSGRVWLVATEHGEEIKLHIFDSGVGVAEADKEKLFEAFHRLHYAEVNQIEGTGIGLTLSKYLVERMDGRIGFDSIEGQGTRFHITLKNADTTKKHEDSRIILYIENNIKNVKSSWETISTACDNHPNIRLLTCQGTEEGLALARSYVPDLIFIDVEPASTDDVAVIKTLQELPELQQSALVALGTVPKQVESATHVEFDNYLVKPINSNEISQFITAIVASTQC